MSLNKIPKIQIVATLHFDASKAVVQMANFKWFQIGFASDAILTGSHDSFAVNAACNNRLSTERDCLSKERNVQQAFKEVNKQLMMSLWSTLFTPDAMQHSIKTGGKIALFSIT